MTFNGYLLGLIGIGGFVLGIAYNAVTPPVATTPTAAAPEQWIVYKLNDDGTSAAYTGPYPTRAICDGWAERYHGYGSHLSVFVCRKEP